VFWTKVFITKLTLPNNDSCSFTTFTEFAHRLPGRA
jgi:hypothetical protein